jgi:hypothetical protein
MISDEIIKDMDLARKILLKTDYSIIVIKNECILIKKRGEGIFPILETIGELKNCINDVIIGDRILGKASALLCKYANVKGVYSPQATKTAIAVLIMAGIPSQIDELIPYIKNRDGNGFCPFEELLKNVNSSEEAYKILSKKFLNKEHKKT